MSETITSRCNYLRKKAFCRWYQITFLRRINPRDRKQRFIHHICKQPSLIAIWYITSETLLNIFQWKIQVTTLKWPQTLIFIHYRDIKTFTQYKRGRLNIQLNAARHPVQHHTAQGEFRAILEQTTKSTTAPHVLVSQGSALKSCPILFLSDQQK